MLLLLQREIFKWEEKRVKEGVGISTVDFCKRPCLKLRLKEMYAVAVRSGVPDTPYRTRRMRGAVSERSMPLQIQQCSVHRETTVALVVFELVSGLAPPAFMKDFIFHKFMAECGMV
jgi:hypothetical protein